MSEAELAAWTKLTITGSAANNAATSNAAAKANVIVGLFSFDITGMASDCAKAFYSCSSLNHLHHFDGWSVGVVANL